MMNRQQAEAMSPKVLAAWERLERVQPSSNPFSHFDAYEAIIDALVEVMGDQAARWAALPEAMATHMVAAYEWDCSPAGWAEEFTAALAARNHKEADGGE